ncbi:MAG: hypothetical protein MHM6MM_006466 [Cercozoa sp. M6MM]
MQPIDTGDASRLGVTNNPPAESPGSPTPITSTDQCPHEQNQAIVLNERAEALRRILERLGDAVQLSNIDRSAAALVNMRKVRIMRKRLRRKPPVEAKAPERLEDGVRPTEPDGWKLADPSRFVTFYVADDDDVVMWEKDNPKDLLSWEFEPQKAETHINSLAGTASYLSEVESLRGVLARVAPTIRLARCVSTMALKPYDVPCLCDSSKPEECNCYRSVTEMAQHLFSSKPCKIVRHSGIQQCHVCLYRKAGNHLALNAHQKLHSALKSRSRLYAAIGLSSALTGVLPRIHGASRAEISSESWTPSRHWAVHVNGTLFRMYFPPSVPTKSIRKMWQKLCFSDEERARFFQETRAVKLDPRRARQLYETKNATPPKRRRRQQRQVTLEDELDYESLTVQQPRMRTRARARASASQLAVTQPGQVTVPIVSSINSPDRNSESTVLSSGTAPSAVC